MIRFLLITVSALALSLFVYLFFHLGVYKKVEFERAERGPMYLLYKAHTGAYHEIGPTIHEAETWANSQNVSCPLTFGEFLDDPSTVDEDRLRSRAGCLLDHDMDNRPGDFTYEQRPAREYLIGKFSGSPAIGPFKVYPAAKEYLDKNGFKSTQPVIEVYHVNGDNVVTEYLFPIDK